MYVAGTYVVGTVCAVLARWVRWSAGARLPTFLALYVLFGAAWFTLIGGLALYDDHPSARAWVLAALAGVVLSFFMAPLLYWWIHRSWPSASTLSPKERRAVIDAVYEGRAIEDPALARATIERADSIVRNIKPLTWRLKLFFAVAFLGVVASNVADGDWLSTAVFVLLGAQFAVTVHKHPETTARLRWHAELAERAARSRL